MARIIDEEFKADMMNKLTPFKNLICMIQNGLLEGTVTVSKYIDDEVEVCKESLKYIIKEINKE